MQGTVHNMYFEFNFVVSTDRDNSVGKVTTLTYWTFEEWFFRLPT